MNVSILHLSDLHRNQTAPIRNSPLLESLRCDRDRYSTQSPSIRNPDLVIVSGDIIHGVKGDDGEAEANLAKQYAEAKEFLAELANVFLDGNRSKLVIVPGNHDVSAYHLLQSLVDVAIPTSSKKKGFARELLKPNSDVRWSWEELKFFKIDKPDTYKKRMEAFCNFYNDFYSGLGKTYDLDPEKHYGIFDFPEFDLTIVGFSSCHNNDIFNKQGMINPVCIGNVGKELRKPSFANRIRIATWHHNTEGMPMQFDYMPPELLQSLIDQNFCIGFHGHQHKPQYMNKRFEYGGERKIVVLSAGTLCGGPAFRFSRSYNLVELDTVELRGKLHLREMQNDNLELPIWSMGVVKGNSAKTHLEFEFDAPTEANFNTTVLQDLDRAQELIGEDKLDQAIEILEPLVKADDLARRILLECVVEKEDTDKLARLFDPPQSEQEIIHLVDALWIEDKKRLGDVLKLPEVKNSSSPAVQDMIKKYSAKISS